MKRVVVRNFFSLISVQIANYILPLIVLPYLARVIGVEKFGTIAFAQAIISYFIIFVTFGFNLYAPREISIIRDNNEKLRNTFWDIIYLRFLLCLICILAYSIMIFTISKFRSELWVFIFSFGFILGDIFLPFWFFQGIEKMTYIAGFNFLMKILYTVSIFIFVKTKFQYIYVPLLYSISQIITGIVAICIIIFSLKLFPVLPDLKRSFKALKDSFILFISNISISIYTKIHPVLLGFFAGDIYVGYYSAAEKLFYAWIGIQGQINTTLYPHISKIAVEKSKEEALNFIKKSFLITMSLAFLAALFFFIFSRSIITIIFSKEFLESVIVLRILSFLFIIIGLSNVFGIQTMLPLNMKKQFAIPIITAGFVNLTFSFILIPVYKHIGASLSFLFSEMWVTIVMFFILKSKGVNLFSNLIFIPKEILNSNV